MKRELVFRRCAGKAAVFPQIQAKEPLMSEYRL